jgi:signal transduction histidine kinase/FixJ family two-component response regulator
MSDDRSGGNIIRKVLLAFGLGAGAVIIAWSISYFGLNRMLTVVYDLGAPNEKLKTLNNLYRKTTALNDQQRIDAIRNPNKPDRDFIEESKELLVILDSLKKMQWNDTLQVSRLSEMQNIIQRRNNLFLSYLRLRSNVNKDKAMASKFDSLTEMLSKEHITADTSVRTSQTKSTTITYLQDSTETEGQKRSFFSKLFKRKPDTPPLPDRTVTEEVEVTVDTIAVAKSNSKLAEATRLIDELGTNELSKRKELADKELALLATSRDLFRELVDIVHRVEAEELEHVRNNNEKALNVVDESSSVVVAILLIFSLMAAALIYLIVIDVSKSNFFRESLVREKERAEELSLVKERFLSNMSHEIRTPLQAIIGYSEQLRSNPLTDTDTAIKAISNSSEHLLHIVNEVLDYSRLESGKIEFEKQGFYPLEVAEEVASALRVQAKAKELELVFDTSLASNEYVEGDQFRLRQVLYNLLGNAIKFTSKGSVKLHVSGAVNDDKLQVRFEVSDTGIGIKPKDVDRIFHRFEQASAAVGNTYGGTGLGLTIVKMIVEAQGGTIRVKSKVGKGSSFVVELSYNIKQQEQVNIQAGRLQVADGMHVLVLDDDKLIVELCTLMLSNGGVPYETHQHPEELFKSGIDPKITHVLMDIRLGNVNGVELCRSLRTRVGKSLKIIAMTAMADSKVLRDSLDDFDGVLRKPFRSDELYALLGTNDRFSVVRKMTNNDEELFQSVLADFMGETDRDIQAVEKAIADQRSDTMLLLVHRLSGRVGQFGFRDLSTSLRQIEIELEKGGAAEKMKERWNELKERLVAALAEIRNSP